MVEVLGGEEVLAEIARQGIWAILYVALFVYVLRESRRREIHLRKDYLKLQAESRDREQKLTNFIREITSQYERLANGIERLTSDVEDIKNEIHYKKYSRYKQKNEEQEKVEKENHDNDKEEL